MSRTNAPGFREDQVGYEIEGPKRLVGQIRRLGTAGPAYEIKRVEEDGTVHVEFVHNDEEMTFPLVEVLEDPIAETIP
jgi:hypothetical protein